MADTQKTAIIIGAGPAGLTAAYQMLKETDMKPIILEETGVIGGISQTAQYKGNRMDIGGHRFFSKSDMVMNLWQEIMPIQGKPAIDDILLGTTDKEFSDNGGDPEKTDVVMLIRRRISRIFYLRHFFDYPISLKPATFQNMGLARTVKAGFGYMHAQVFKREEKSLEDFYINRFGKPLYSMFFEDYTEKLWGVHPSEIAPDWGKQRVKGLSLWGVVAAILKKPFISKEDKSKIETSLIEQFFYPKKGPGQLWELMAEKIQQMGGEIRFNTPINGIRLENGRIASVSSNGEEYQGDYYLSSMPIKDLVAAIESEVPEAVREIASGLPYRDFITAGLLLNKLKIKNETKLKTVSNIVPDCWIYIQERDVRIGRLQVFNNWSPYMVKDLENTVWVGLEYFCDEGDEMWNKSDEDFIRFAIDELHKIDVIDKEDVLDSVRIRVKKAYPAYFGVYSRFDELRRYLDSLENLYCIGRNGQHRYNNMDHSMMTAVEAVKLIASGSNDKSAVWNVNTEEEYHEEKK
ncbi:MAG: NAD(P)/FAD-dependent oxidoreductase [Oscillospiraceae bacterium]|jgi:protoporphyrinogen oxidase|nr:NAD(P)/FAD-dependent oxidoreductase [Oscillospiraceae bacterium]